MKKKILFLDDDEIVVESFKYIMTDLNYEVETFTDSESCLEMAVKKDFDLIITDMRMPGINGAEFIKGVIQKKPNARIYILTGYPGDEIVKTALETGAKGIMEKPFEVSKIVDLMNTN